MNKHEQSKSTHSGVIEMPTAKRFSLEDPSINRIDILRGPEKHTERYIEYPTPLGVHTQKIRAYLISKKNILGKLDQSSMTGTDTFRIQSGAKPIMHGAIFRTKGVYSYNETNYFSI